MVGGFLNARDFGAVGSSFSTCARSVAGSSAIVTDVLGDFKVGDEGLL
jgi:hypothetical protein